ncbi:MAG: hypothetical protein AT715_06890 [Thermoproteus sp. JCHS_4]|nr:MAG: hypothetical protein AT715_06890 [Thermoproteus sp. JCHS_4]
MGDYVTVSTRVKREMVERRELGINTQFLREKLEEEFRRRGSRRYLGSIAHIVSVLSPVMRALTTSPVRNT